MIKIYRILLSVILLSFYSCTCQDEDKNAHYFSANFYIKNFSSFNGAGYTTVKIMEYDKIIDKNTNSNHISLSIALNKTHSTFIFIGDSIADTIQIAGYSVQPYLQSDYCGYQLQMTEPTISYSTFTDYQFTYYDTSTYSMHVGLFK